MMFSLATTAATGCPFAMGFPKVTTSGESLSHSWPHQLSPVRPNPGWTSSEIKMPPAALIICAQIIKAAGGILISDEVQPGFGRTGDNWWGHEWLKLSPDVVTLGKPMANGHPVAAVVAKENIMADFRNAFGYFNTFGGNPVSLQDYHQMCWSSQKRF